MAGWKTQERVIDTPIKEVNEHGVMASDASTGLSIGWIPPREPDAINTKLMTDYKLSRSVDTPGWDVPKSRYVVVRAKQRRYSPKPVPPVPRYPLSPLPPVKREGASEGSYQRALRKYYAKYALYQGRLKKAEKIHLLRLAKYARRLAAWEQSFLRRNYLKEPTKYTKVGVVYPSQNNPYEYTKFRDTGWKCNVDTRQTGHGELLPWPWTPGRRYFVLNPRTGGNTLIQRSYFEGVWSNVPKLWPTSNLGAFPTMPSVSPQAKLVAVAAHKASNQFYERVSESSAHVGNMIAERAQTFNMLQSSVTRLRTFLNGPKKAVSGYLTGAFATSGRVANDFIMYCFGVEPLAKDVYELAQKLNKSLRDESKSDMVKVRSGGSADDLQVIEINNPNYYEVIRIRTVTRVRYMAEYRVNNSQHDLNSFGLINPLSVAWEITPWSFVIDWFYPIGQFINSMSAEVGLTFRTGTKSVHTKVDVTYKRTYKPYAPQQYDNGWTRHGTIERELTMEWKQREVLSEPPVKYLPRFKNPLSGRHLALSLSLWRQRIQ